MVLNAACALDIIFPGRERKICFVIGSHTTLGGYCVHANWWGSFASEAFLILRNLTLLCMDPATQCNGLTSFMDIINVQVPWASTYKLVLTSYNGPPPPPHTHYTHTIQVLVNLVKVQL